MKFSVDSFPGRELQRAGRHFLYFGGTSYLGLQTDPDFQDLFIQNVKRYGTNYGASRRANVQLSIFEEAEATLASISGSEACLTLSSGYLAGQLVAQHFDQDIFDRFYAPNTHSALWQKGTLPIIDPADLQGSLQQTAPHKTPVLFLDSIDTTGCSYPDFEGLRKLPLDRMILVVDDSHGIGIMGTNGGGAYALLRELNPKELIVCCSLGKGFGIQAGALFGIRARLDLLQNTELFGGASPAAPAALATLVGGQSIYQSRLQRLRQNLGLFVSKISSQLGRFQFLPEHPAFSFEDVDFTHFLEDNGIVVTNFKYPNENGVLTSRIVISAAHTPEDIQRISGLVNSYA